MWCQGNLVGSVDECTGGSGCCLWLVMGCQAEASDKRASQIERDV